MSWHGRWRKDAPDPHAKPAEPGERFGCFEVIGPAETHPHYGLRVVVRCRLCGDEQVRVLTALRSSPPGRHKGCTGGTS